MQGEQRRTAFGAVFARTALQRVWPEGEEAALAAADAAAQQLAYPPSRSGASQKVLAVYTPTADSGIAGSLSQKHAYQAAAQQSMAALVALTLDGASTAQPMVQQVAYESTSPQPQARLSSSSPALMYTDSTHNVSNSVQSRPGSQSLGSMPSKPRAQEADVLLLITQLLGILQDKGYVCG